MDQSVSGENFTLPAGTKVFLGAPANPMDAALVRSITELVVSIPAVLEAHLPQCHIPGIMQQSAQILVIGLASAADTESVLSQLHAGLGRLTLPNHHLDIWPQLINSDLLRQVRATNCAIVPATRAVDRNPTARRWWKFW
jgi:hypothetical protein